MIFGHKNVYFIFKITPFRPFREYKLNYEIMYYSSIQHKSSQIQGI